MTKDRRRKAEIRAQQARTGSRYLVARRQVAETTSTPPAAPTAAIAGRIDILPPLAAWNRPIECRFWAQLVEEHGPLIAFRIRQGDRWWELDDLAREVAGALQDRPASERGFWLGVDGFSVTKREHLAGIWVALDAAGALPRLTVRSVPDAVRCEHASCRRRLGQPPAHGVPRRPQASRQPGARSAAPFGPALSLAEVMERQPLLNEFGFGLFEGHRRKTPEERRLLLHEGREKLRRREGQILRMRGWLRSNITPIKTPTVGSYAMKHVVERAMGRYVTNGELIAAALMAGYAWKGPYGPNALFAMSKRDVDRIAAG